MSKTVFRYRARLVTWATATVVVVAGVVWVTSMGPSRPAAATHVPYVVASIAPLADIVHQVAGERLQVRTLLPPGASPHTFEPTPAEVVLLSEARVFFRIGLSLELWADRLVLASPGASLRVVTVSNGIEVIKTDADEEHDHGSGADPSPGGGGNRKGAADVEANPHIWLDPVLAVRITLNVRDGLIAADPDHRVEYETRAAAYVEKLEALAAHYRSALANVPFRRIVVFHNAFAYLARRYNLEIVGVIEESPGKEPSAKHVAALIDRIRTLNARAVLVEPQFNAKLGETIAKDAGVTLATVDPLGTPERPETMTYLGLMESNLQRLVGALGGGEP